MKSPRYRGAFTVPDLENTGTIGGQIMNRGDYIMYTGQPQGTWQNARMYEWTGTNWVLLEIADNRWRYLDGINDLTDGALDGIFGNAFIQTLIAKTAIIDQIFSRQITLHEDGAIQSENFNEGQSGFIVKGNGDAEFNNAVFRGRIEADSGFFNNITAINLTTNGLINGIPIAGFARNHGDDYPVGTILMAIANIYGTDGSTPRPIIVNSTGFLTLSNDTYGSYYLLNGGAFGNVGTRLPGTWRISGTGVSSGSSRSILVRRVD